MVDHNQVNQEREDKAVRAAGRLVTRIGLAAEKMDKYVTEGPDDDRIITGFNFKVRYDNQGDVLLVVRSRTVNGEEVGFQSADTPTTALVSAINRIENGQFQWKEDVPYGQRKAN